MRKFNIYVLTQLIEDYLELKNELKKSNKYSKKMYQGLIKHTSTSIVNELLLNEKVEHAKISNNGVITVLINDKYGQTLYHEDISKDMSIIYEKVFYEKN